MTIHIIPELPVKIGDVFEMQKIGKVEGKAEIIDICSIKSYGNQDYYFKLRLQSKKAQSRKIETRLYYIAGMWHCGLLADNELLNSS